MYIGQFHNDKLDGKGVMQWPDGRKYDGEWQMDNMHGLGSFTWADGRSYEGGWRNNQPHGTAKFTTASGEIKMGLWENGKKVKWHNTKDVNQKRLELNNLQEVKNNKEKELLS